MILFKIIVAVMAIALITTCVVKLFEDDRPNLGKEPICDRCSWQKGQDDWKYCMAPWTDVVGCPYNSYKHGERR